MLGRRLLVLSTLMCSGALSATSAGEHKVWDINYRRQVATPQPPPSINPSPPLGAPPAPTTLNIIPSITAPPMPASSPVVLISILPSSASSSSATSPSVTTAASSSSDIITISALPPLDPTAIPTQVTYPKKRPESEPKFKLIYLVPVFVLFGILWGSLAAWLAYGCLTRRPKVQNDVLIGGPCYVPAPRDLEDGESLRRDDMQEVAFSWLDFKQATEKLEDEEDDPFLLPPSPTKAKSARTKSARSTMTTYSDATYALELDDEDKKKEEVPWESLRHKSIKRGILEEVKKEGHRIDSLRPTRTLRNTGTGTRKMVARRTSKHERTDSDYLISDIDSLLTTTADPNVTCNSRPPNYRADSEFTTVSIISTTTNGDKTQWKPGAGFRIVAESPASSRGPTPVPTDGPAAFGMSWATAPSVDRYTPALTRHDTSRSRSASPVKGTTLPTTPIRPLHAAVLPQSPPQITSPLLENNLCFTPSRAPRTFVSPTTTPTRQLDISRKLRSPKIPPLPFPVPQYGSIHSPKSDMYRGRLLKSPPKAQRPPMTSKSSSSSTTYTRDADGRLVHAANKKVEDIVERSWGVRDLGDEGMKSLSPTGFGRMARD